MSDNMAKIFFHCDDFAACPYTRYLDVIYLLFILNINHHQDYHAHNASKSKGQIVAITVIFLAKYDHLSCKYLVKYEDGLLVFKIYERCFSSHTIRIVEENHNQALHERHLARMDFWLLWETSQHTRCVHYKILKSIYWTVPKTVNLKPWMSGKPKKNLHAKKWLVMVTISSICYYTHVLFRFIK